MLVISLHKRRKVTSGYSLLLDTGSLITHMRKVCYINPCHTKLLAPASAGWCSSLVSSLALLVSTNLEVLAALQHRRCKGAQNSAKAQHYMWTCQCSTALPLLHMLSSKVRQQEPPINCAAETLGPYTYTCCLANNLTTPTAHSMLHTARCCPTCCRYTDYM